MEFYTLDFEYTNTDNALRDAPAQESCDGFIAMPAQREGQEPEALEEIRVGSQEPVQAPQDCFQS